METVDYRITEGSDYGWQCFGNNAYMLDSWNGAHDETGYTVNIIFDNQTQIVYQMEAWDYKNEREYRWINPDFKEAYEAESKQRSVPLNESLDDRNFIDLDSADDMLIKARAIVLGKEYDTRVVIPVDLPQETLFQLMMLAHENDITLNDFVENIIRAELCLLKEND